MTAETFPQIQDHVVRAEDEKIFNTFSGFLLVYFKEGTGTFCLNGEIKDYAPGTTVIMSCLDYLKKEVSAISATITVLDFSDTTFSGRIPEIFSIRTLPLCTNFSGEERDRAETLLELLHGSVNSSEKNNDIFLKNLSKELIIYTIRNTNPDITRSVYDIKTELAILYIYSHFKESLSLEAVAAHVHYSANYFYHNFQKNTGTTFQKFLHDLRFEYALNLLRFTDLTISDICYECGYNSVQYFSTAFRKKFGTSPKKFINTINKKEKEL